MKKSIFSSWTFWFGLLQVMLGVIGLLSGLMDSQAAQALIVTGVGTVGFRIKTTTGVSL